MFCSFLLANCRTSQAQGKTCFWVLSWQALTALTGKAVLDTSGCHWVIWVVWVNVALCYAWLFCPSVNSLQCPECFCCRKHFSASQEAAFEENAVFAATPTIAVVSFTLRSIHSGVPLGQNGPGRSCSPVVRVPCSLWGTQAAGPPWSWLAANPQHI